MVLHESARAQRLLPGAAVIARIRRLFVLALIASFAYGVFSTGGRALALAGLTVTAVSSTRPATRRARSPCASP